MLGPRYRHITASDVFWLPNLGYIRPNPSKKHALIAWFIVQLLFALFLLFFNLFVTGIFRIIFVYFLLFIDFYSDSLSNLLSYILISSSVRLYVVGRHGFLAFRHPAGYLISPHSSSSLPPERLICSVDWYFTVLDTSVQFSPSFVGWNTLASSVPPLFRRIIPPGELILLQILILTDLGTRTSINTNSIWLPLTKQYCIRRGKSYDTTQFSTNSTKTTYLRLLKWFNKIVIKI